ncbi:2367_t:CDS:2, partial [Acaulospora morrowiae]
STCSKILTYDSINLHVKKDLGFDAVIGCNIGNPQQLLQQPITFFRQVASLIEYPDLLLSENKEHVKALYSPDAIECTGANHT